MRKSRCLPRYPAGYLLRRLLIDALLAVLIIAIALPAAPGQAQAPAPVTAFVDVSVVPMDRERVLAGQTVLVRGGTIMAMGPTPRVRVPAGAVRIDGHGKFLIPGLADMHAHVPGLYRSLGGMSQFERGFGEGGSVEAERMLLLNVLNGVTTVRVMHGWPETLRLRDRAARGELLSPRLYVARRAIELAHAEWADSAARIVEDVEAAKAAGYDLIKVHGALNGNGASHDSLIAVARRLNIPVAGHASETPVGQGLKIALRAHYASIEHLTGFRTYLIGGADRGLSEMFVMDWPKDSVDTTKLRALARAFQRAKVWNCPTQVNYEYAFSSGHGMYTAAAWPELRYVDDSMRTLWAADEADSAVQARAREMHAGMDARRQIIRALRDAGAGLLLGTDAAQPPLVPGFAVHRELQALVRAGLTPYEALATGTRNVAAYFGTLDSTGTVAVGKRADLVLLNGNPLADIQNTMSIAGVMLHGHWLPRAALDTALATLEGTLYAWPAR